MKTSSATAIPDARVITLPVTTALTDRPRANRAATNFRYLRLSEAQVLRIVNRSLRLVVGGPPNSGKSTFAASLVVELNAILDSLQSRGGPWTQLAYSAEAISLDAATPVADAVLSGRGHDKHYLTGRKTRWTKTLARGARAKVRTSASEKPKLVISDLPGLVGDITEILVKDADAAFIVTNAWKKAGEWRDFFEDSKLPIIGEFESVESTSMITTFWRGRVVRGRIHRPDRVASAWDPTVRTFAELLLFDILPARFGI